MADEKVIYTEEQLHANTKAQLKEIAVGLGIPEDQVPDSLTKAEIIALILQQQTTQETSDAGTPADPADNPAGDGTETPADGIQTDPQGDGTETPPADGTETPVDLVIPSNIAEIPNELVDSMNTGLMDTPADQVFSNAEETSDLAEIQDIQQDERNAPNNTKVRKYAGIRATAEAREHKGQKNSIRDLATIRAGKTVKATTGSIRAEVAKRTKGLN